MYYLLCQKMLINYPITNYLLCIRRKLAGMKISDGYHNLYVARVTTILTQQIDLLKGHVQFSDELITMYWRPHNGKQLVKFIIKADITLNLKFKNVIDVFTSTKVRKKKFPKFRKFHERSLNCNVSQCKFD